MPVEVPRSVNGSCKIRAGLSGRVHFEISAAYVANCSWQSAICDSVDGNPSRACSSQNLTSRALMLARVCRRSARSRPECDFRFITISFRVLRAPTLSACQVLSDARREDGPSFLYTVGVFDICARPEIIEIGIHQNAANALLNEDEERAGLHLSGGKQSGLINGVDYEFRMVDPRSTRRVTLGTNSFYHRRSFGVTWN
jgi:hypothetical protein